MYSQGQEWIPEHISKTDPILWELSKAMGPSKDEIDEYFRILYNTTEKI